MERGGCEEEKKGRSRVSESFIPRRLDRGW
jgi:hypothetical protein